MQNIYFTELEYRWLFAVALPCVLCAWVWVWHKSRRAKDRFVPKSRRIFDETARFTGVCTLVLCDLLLASILIAGIMHPERRVIIMEPVREHTATVVAIDISSSMRSEAGYFGEGGRMGAVKQALRELLETPEAASGALRKLFGNLGSFFAAPSIRERRLMEGQRIGIVTFGGRAMNEMPLTARHGTILSVLRLLATVRDAQDDGTNFPAALDESLLLFNKDDKIKAIILFTDGEEEEGRALPVGPSLEKAVASGVKIFPIVVGHERAPVPGKDNVFTEPSTALPEYLAKRTGGESFRFDERGKLYPLLTDIFSKVDSASREPVEKREDLQRWCAALFLAMFTVRTLTAYLVRGDRSLY